LECMPSLTSSGTGLLGRKAIFLTGAGGVVGQALIRHKSEQQFTCLAHKKRLDAPNVEPVSGDVCHPRLGMSPDTYDKLADSIDCIVHSAAITDFTSPPDRIAAVNIDGTHRVLELAARAGVPLYHISTAFIRPHSDAEPTSYELSKIMAEEAVSTSGLPATILRPSVILGDALTGEIASFQGFYFLVGVFLKGHLPFVPALPESYIDFVPQDLVADILIALIQQKRIGDKIWLTAGTRALRIDDIVDCCINEIPSIGPALDRPNMINQDTYERLFKPVFYPSLPKHQRRLMDRAMTMVKYLNTVEAMPSDSPALERSLNVRPMPDPRVTLRSALMYWTRFHGLAPNVAGLEMPGRRVTL
jgi:nucleoside-diphosphate-sugar epimerase